MTMLSPHVLRLLKLIHEGTHEHARKAIDQLVVLMKDSEQVWDVLGRLQGYLVNPSWASRRNAALALELCASYVTLESTDAYWTLEAVDFQDIIEKGRPLLGVSDSNYDQMEEELLQELDDGEEGFVLKRERLQRQILAQKLGIAAFEKLTGNLILPDLAPESKPNKRKLDQESKSVRELLVSAAKTGNSPQQILSSELAYRMFDPCWYIRHGAILGVFGLARKWEFGPWFHDALVRSLAIMCLDRFADFGGQAAVAPVREVTGQLIATLFSKAPSDVQSKTVDVLEKLASTDNVWEIRHGALLAIKFAANTLSDGQPSTNQWKDRFRTISLSRIQDPSDDVKAAAYQVLLYLGGTDLSVLVDSLKDAAPEASFLPDLLALILQHVRRGESDFDLNILVSVLPVQLRSEYSSVVVCALELVAAVLDCEGPSRTSQKTCGVETIIDAIYDMVLYSPLFDQLDVKDKIDLAWGAVCKAVQLETVFPPSALTFRRLLASYFLLDFKGSSVRNFVFSRQLVASRMLSTLVTKLTGTIQQQSLERLRNFVLPNLQVQILELRLSALLLQRDLSLLDIAAADEILDSVFSILNTSEETMSSMSSIDGEKLFDTLKRFFDCSSNDSTNLAGALVEAFTEKSIAGDESNMRIRALAAACYTVTVQPPKLTPFIRALVTSMNNELDPDYFCVTCDALRRLLVRLFHNDRKGMAFQKVLRSLIMKVSTGWDLDLEEKLCLELEMVLAHSLALFRNDAQLLDKSTLAEINVLGEHFDTWFSDVNTIVELPHEKLIFSIRVLNGLVPSLSVDDPVSRDLITLTLPSVIESCGTHADDCSMPPLISLIGRMIRLMGKDVSTDVLEVSAKLLTSSTSTTSSKIYVLKLVESFVSSHTEYVIPYIRSLMPLLMLHMKDKEETITRLATRAFAGLVRLGPLFKSEEAKSLKNLNTRDAEEIFDHLILGRQLPPCPLSPRLERALVQNGVTIRPYQMEGITWLNFLQTINMGGALTDEMGLGKTLQSLIAVGLAHERCNWEGAVSLIVCPASLVNHWVSEVKKYFDSCQTFCVSTLKELDTDVNCFSRSDSNLLIVSYNQLRAHIELLSKQEWTMCVLDEGHLLKNPKTATAQSSRRLKARYKLILTGTPVQNRVNEIWAMFDFLIPNFLGSNDSFSREYASPIMKGQKSEASADEIHQSMEKLKVLHQQVLPFILRREKGQVLKELPPKNVSTLYTDMTSIQTKFYNAVQRGKDVSALLRILQSKLGEGKGGEAGQPDSNALKTLLALRQVCTHPILIATSKEMKDALNRFDVSSKLVAMVDLLRSSGISDDDFAAADNDQSLLYCDDNMEDQEDEESFERSSKRQRNIPLTEVRRKAEHSSGKCLIFAQFGRSLDLIEDIVLKSHMPRVKYLRIDGKIPASKRAEIADRFNKDENVAIMLLTTRVGSLGLNLSGADLVIFVESDYNPYVDIQAMDRAHRIGQTKTVNVVRLVTKDTIEEAIMLLQAKKKVVGDAIVNTDNSSLFSMGTDRLLDIFSAKDVASKDEDGADLEALIEESVKEYMDLSVEKFVEYYDTSTV